MSYLWYPSILDSSLNIQSFLWWPCLHSCHLSTSSLYFFFFLSSLNLMFYCFCFVFCFFGCKACRILASLPGIEPAPPAMGVWSQPLNHQESPCLPIFLINLWESAERSLPDRVTYSAFPFRYLCAFLMSTLIFFWGSKSSSWVGLSRCPVFLINSHQPSKELIHDES